MAGNGRLKERGLRVRGCLIGVCYQPIGRIQSCFKERNGTPRQGLLAPHSRAILKVEAQYQPGQSLIGAIPIQMAVCSMILIARQSPRPLHRHFHHLWLFITFGTGLQEFSHVWLLFDFHENTNQRQHTKVHPPMLDGEASGVFATRCADGACFAFVCIRNAVLTSAVGCFKTALPRRCSKWGRNLPKETLQTIHGRTPHRPNSIGLSLAMLDSVDMGRGTENAFAPFSLQSSPDELRLRRPRTFAWHRCD